jgi:hypothetical protein
MRTNGCRRFRSALTSYVDGEMAAAERRRIEEHLERCDGCRRRVGREEAMRQRLQRWSAEMKTAGALLALPPGSNGRSSGAPRGMLLRVAAVFAAVVLALVIYGLRTARTDGVLAATGLITDSRCAGGHTHTAPALRDVSSGDCVRRCVEMGAEYVFVSQGVVYAIRNQDFADLTRLAGHDVQVEGEVRQNVLTVSSVRSSIASRSHTEHSAQDVPAL